MRVVMVRGVHPGKGNAGAQMLLPLPVPIEEWDCEGLRITLFVLPNQRAAVTG